MTDKKTDAIDVVLVRLMDTIDADSKQKRSTGIGNMVEVGSYELRDLLEYVDCQRQNLVTMERIVNTILGNVNTLSQEPFGGWGKSIKALRESMENTRDNENHFV